MKIKIKLLRPFSDVVGRKEFYLDFKGQNISDLIKTLVKKYPKLENEFYKETKELSEFVCIFVNDKPITALDGLDTILKDGNELLFFMPVSGG